MKKHLAGLLLLLTLLCGAALASAQEAPDLTSQVTFTSAGKRTKPKEMRDRNYNTYYTVRKGGHIELDSGEAAMAYLKVQFYERASDCLVEAWQDEGWVEIGRFGAFLSDWVEIPEGVTRLRLTNLSKGRMYLAEVTAYGEGDRPADAPVWRTADKADMMLVVAHPDDELLWFGGLLPTYAGERGLTVQVVYVVPTTPNRRLELLDGLRHCGVDVYPAFVGMKDTRSNTLAGQYKRWNKTRLFSTLTEFVRRYRPDVLVTQDFNGEYGHGAHRATADAATKAAVYAADSSKYADSAKAYGVWQVSKVYVHLYDQQQLQLDWHVPLEAFGGKDGETITTEALACHVSQMKHGWAMEEGGANDNTLFGLYYTNVGPDTAGNDLMEHITP